MNRSLYRKHKGYNSSIQYRDENLVVRENYSRSFEMKLDQGEVYCTDESLR